MVVLVLLSLSGLSCQAWRHFPLHSSPSPSSSSSSSSFSSMSPSSSSLSLAKITSDLLNLPTIDPKISPKYTNIPSLLNTLKIKGTIRKWGSTNLDYRSISEVVSCIYIHTYIHTYMLTYKLAYIHTYIHTYTCTYTYAYSYSYT